MGTYLVESFMPGGRAEPVIGAARHPGVTTAAGRFLQLLALPHSELCLCVVEAPSHAAAGDVVRSAGLTVDGLPEVVELIEVAITNNPQENR
jgi:hypothetical protein